MDPVLYPTGPITGAINIAAKVSTPDALPGPVNEVSWFVPGRIEVLGKHTDYAGGRSLLAAVDRGITFTARRIDEPVVRVYSSAVGESVDIQISGDRPPLPPGHWAAYPEAVVTRLEANFPGYVVGAQIDVDSTLPLASGMSSSSAMVIGISRCLIDLGGIASLALFRRHIRDYESLAGYMACIENGMTFGDLKGRRGVGTFGGSEDHTAMLCCEQGKLAEYSFSPVRRRALVPVPEGYAFVVAVSGVLAEKTGAARDAYNRVSLAVREIVGLWNSDTGRTDTSLPEAIASSEHALDRMRELVGEDNYLRRRLDQFYAESEEIVPLAADALAGGHLKDFGELVDRSQQLAQTGLENQVQQTVFLARSARQLGAQAASAFGAGFGGSVWALVRRESAEEFASKWLKEYLRVFPYLKDRAATHVAAFAGRAYRRSTNG